MKLYARCLPLLPPYLIVGIKYAVAEKVAYGVPKVPPFRENKELGFEKMLDVARIRGDNAVEAAKPRSFESKRPVLQVKDVGDPFVHVGSEPGDQGRQHSKDWPNRQAMMFLLPR